MRKFILSIFLGNILIGCSVLKGNYSATGRVEEVAVGKEAVYANIVTDNDIQIQAINIRIGNGANKIKPGERVPAHNDSTFISLTTSQSK